MQHATGVMPDMSVWQLWSTLAPVADVSTKSGATPVLVVLEGTEMGKLWFTKSLSP